MTDKETRRLFFAVELDEAVRQNLASLVERLQKAAQFTPVRISWVPASHFHTTLYFLGETSQQIADQLATLLPEAVKDIPPFPLDIRHIGVFPKDSGRPPRVLWAGVHNPPDALMRLRERCASIIARAGLPVPDQNFTPHITLARFRSAKGLHPFQRVLQEYQFFKAGKCEVGRLALMESHTGGGPARYEPYATAPFSV